MADVTPKKHSCIVTLSYHRNYTQTAIAEGMLRRGVWTRLHLQKYLVHAEFIEVQVQCDVAPGGW